MKCLLSCLAAAALLTAAATPGSAGDPKGRTSVPAAKGLQSQPKSSKAIIKIPDVSISSFQTGGSDGKKNPPPPPPKDDCMSCAD